MHRVLLWHRAVQYPPGDHKASTALEIEIHSKRRNAPREYRGQHQLGVTGNGRLPFGGNGGTGFFCVIVSSVRVPPTKQIEYDAGCFCDRVLDVRAIPGAQHLISTASVFQ